MHARSFAPSDVFDLIALTQHQGSQDIAQALVLHARDFCAEQENEDRIYSTGELLAEMYWRTYFSEESSKTTGTFDYVGGNLEVAKTFIDYISGGLLMDKASEASGFPLIADAGGAAH